MKALRILVVLLLLLVLDWFAVHDILLKGTSYLTRYAILISSLPLIMLSVLWLLRPKMSKQGTRQN